MADMMDNIDDDHRIFDDANGLNDDIASESSDSVNEVMHDFQNLPSLDEVMKLIESMKELSDDDRQKLKMSLLEQQAEASEKLSQYASAQSNLHTMNDYLIFIAMVGLIITVFVLFGYKLYKSLMEKQKKREEKLKAKQSKKKK